MTLGQATSPAMRNRAAVLAYPIELEEASAAGTGHSFPAFDSELSRVRCEARMAPAPLLTTASLKTVPCAVHLV